MLDARLTYVLAVSREGSFTAAARAIGVTQPAVTKSIADLERQVGYAIFYRTPGGAIPTENGKAFIARAGRIVEDALELLSKQVGADDPYAGVLRIGIAPAAMEWQAVDGIELLLKRHPSVRLETTGGSFERTVNQLRDGAIDVAVGLDDAFAGWPELERKTIGMLQSDLFARKEHPLANRPSSSRIDLAQYDFVTLSESKPYGEIVRGFYEAAGMPWRSKIHVADYFPTVARIVRSTDAISMVQRAYTRTSSFTRYFTALEVDEEVFPPSLLCCAYRAHRELTPAMRAFIAAVRDSNGRRT